MGYDFGDSNDDIAIEINLFGGFSLRVDGEVRPRPRTQVRQLLALGALANLSVDAAIDQLWPDDIPADPRRAFRVIASRCRTAIAPYRDAFHIDTGTVRLDANSDVGRYQRLLSGADEPAGNRSRLDQLTAAFALRSGLPFDTCDDLAELVALQSKLGDVERHAIIEAAPLLAAAGRARSAVELLEPVWNQNMTDEAVGLALAQALASNTQRSRALEVLDRTRIALRDEHGLSLGPVATEILNELLRSAPGGEPVHSLTLAQSRQIPLVGVNRILRDVPTERGDVAVIEGFAGDGKSTIATELERRWVAECKPVIRVEAPTNPTRPMQVVAEAITALIDQRMLDPDQLDDQTGAAVRRLVRDLPGVAAKLAITRESLIARLSDLIVSCLDDRGAALIIDDLQCCDLASIEVLRGVIDQAHHQVVLTTRVVRPPFVNDLIRHRRCQLVRLDGLERHEVAELIERCLPQRRVDVDQLYTRSGGHPLFVNLLIGLMIDGDVADELPSTVLLAVRHRTATLSRAANEALSLLSLFPNGVSIDILRQIRPTIDIETIELEAANLLRTGSEIRIRHAVVCEAVSQLVPSGNLIAWHDRIGWLMEERGLPPSSWVDHALAAVEFDPQRAAWAAVAAAADYANAFAWERVLELAVGALDICTRFDLTDAPTEGLAHLWAGRAQLALSMADDGDGALLRAVEIAEQIGDDELLANAVIELCSFGRVSPRDPLGDELHARIIRLRQGHLDAQLRCELAAAAGTLLSVSRLQQDGRDLFMQGYSEVRDLGNVEVERRVLMHLHLALGHPDDLRTRIEGAQRLRSIAGSDPDILWQASYLDFGVGLMMADRDTVDASIVALRELAPRLRLRDRSFGLAFTEASYARALGDLERAERFAVQTAELGRQRFPENWVTFVVTAIIAAVTEANGALRNLAGFAEPRIEINPDFPIWHVIAAVAAADLGDDQRARAELDFLRRRNFALVPDLSWSAAIGLLAYPVVLVEDVQAATILGDLFRPFSGYMAWNGVTTHLPVDHYLAMYDSVSGVDRGVDYRLRAQTTMEALTRPPGVVSPTT